MNVQLSKNNVGTESRALTSHRDCHRKLWDLGIWGLTATGVTRSQRATLLLLDLGVHSVPASLLMFVLSCIPGIANESKKLYGAQFHPEVSLTVNGKMILKNFLYDIAGCSGTFTVENRELQCIQDIKDRVGSSKVLVSSGRAGAGVQSWGCLGVMWEVGNYWKCR